MLCDDQDLAELEQHSWCARQQGTNWYALTNVRKKGRKTMISAHRLLLHPPKHLQVDHINHNGLDNRRCNLRVCTRQGNQQNRIAQIATSEFKGVSWHEHSKKWLARIKVDKRIHHLGMYESELHAARAYDIAAKKHHKEYAYLNNVDASIIPVQAVKESAAKKSNQKGCYWDSHGEVWKVKFRVEGKLRTLGTFHLEHDAVVCAQIWASSH